MTQRMEQMIALLQKRRIVAWKFEGIDFVDARLLRDAMSTNSLPHSLEIINSKPGPTMGETGISDLADALTSSNTKLKKLRLEFGGDNGINGEKISQQGALRLAGSLQCNTVLETLVLCRTQLGDNEAMMFASALIVNKTLRILDLSGNAIGDVGAASLATALLVNTTLQALIVSRNPIADAGIGAIANMLTEN